jgi:hypothetical protein
VNPDVVVVHVAIASEAMCASILQLNGITR